MKAVSKLLVLVTLTALSACAANTIQTQTNLCPLDLVHSPSLAGLKLGMNVGEVKAKYPNSFDYSTLSWGEVDATSTTRIENTSQVKCKFLDGTLYWMEVTYQGTVHEWKIDGFERKSKEKFGLKTEWLKSLSEHSEYCQCNGFELKISGPYEVLDSGRLRDFEPVIQIKDTKIADVASQRESKHFDEERSKKQKDFSP